MKVVSTKLDNEEFEKFENQCSDEGCSKSETLRKLIRSYFEPYPESETLEDKEEPKELENATVVIVEDDEDKKPHHDKYGNYWHWNDRTQKWAVDLNL